MQPITPFDDRTRWAKLVRYAVALPYAFFPLAYFAWATVNNQPVDMLIWFLIIAFTIVSAYAVFGKKLVKDALDETTEIMDEQEPGETPNPNEDQNT